jgi:hypothetical protein
MKQWRGLSALVEDAVEHGSRAVERIHMVTAARPFRIIEYIPGVAAPTRVVHTMHDVAVTTTYRTIRLVNRAVGIVVGVTLEALDDEGPAGAESDVGDPGGSD